MLFLGSNGQKREQSQNKNVAMNIAGSMANAMIKTQSAEPAPDQQAVLRYI